MCEAWRAACLAYRRVRQSGKLHHPAHVAAVEAVLEILPGISREEASRQAQNAVSWAASEHTEWFWRASLVPGSLATGQRPSAEVRSGNRTNFALTSGECFRSRDSCQKEH